MNFESSPSFIFFQKIILLGGKVIAVYLSHIDSHLLRKIEVKVG